MTREELIQAMARDLDKGLFDAMRFGGTTNNTTQHSPPITVEGMLASIKLVMRDMPPAPPQIVQSEWLLDTIEDWSRVRSRGRAARRREHGHRQNIVVTKTPKKDAYQIDGKLYVHPVTWRKALEAGGSSDRYI